MMMIDDGEGNDGGLIRVMMIDHEAYPKLGSVIIGWKKITQI